MQRTTFSSALIIAALMQPHAMAEESEPGCELESIGRLALSSSPEKDFIIASGNKCHLDVNEAIQLVIKTYDGRIIYEGEIAHSYLGTSGISKEEDFERTVEVLAQSGRRLLPDPDQLSVEPYLHIDRADYDRLRAARAPAYAFKHYYAGETLIVYDEKIGRMVEAIDYGT